ncbi:collagen alpha-1(I) chain-like isoform X2 [Dermacentor albipictus]|uniref:collagen alpha-1(I) chain-like isoform X2 n=1 Tax=Dermacentor albipictus TaxID=60249 RepID=UPI0038FCFEDA
MSESQTSLTRRLRKKRPVCQPQGKGGSSRTSIGRHVRPRSPFVPRRRQETGGQKVLRPRHSSTCHSSGRPRRGQNVGGQPGTARWWAAERVRRALAALDHTQLFRAAPDARRSGSAPAHRRCRTHRGDRGTGRVGQGRGGRVLRSDLLERSVGALPAPGGGPRRQQQAAGRQGRRFAAVRGVHGGQDGRAAGVLVPVPGLAGPAQLGLQALRRTPVVRPGPQERRDPQSRRGHHDGLACHGARAEFVIVHLYHHLLGRIAAAEREAGHPDRDGRQPGQLGDEQRGRALPGDATRRAAPGVRRGHRARPLQLAHARRAAPLRGHLRVLRVVIPNGSGGPGPQAPAAPVQPPACAHSAADQLHHSAGRSEASAKDDRRAQRRQWHRHQHRPHLLRLQREPLCETLPKRAGAPPTERPDGRPGAALRFAAASSRLPEPAGAHPEPRPAATGGVVSGATGPARGLRLPLPGPSRHPGDAEQHGAQLDPGAAGRVGGRPRGQPAARLPGAGGRQHRHHQHGPAGRARGRPDARDAPAGAVPRLLQRVRRPALLPGALHAVPAAAGAAAGSHGRPVPVVRRRLPAARVPHAAAARARPVVRRQHAVQHRGRAATAGRTVPGSAEHGPAKPAALAATFPALLGLAALVDALAGAARRAARGVRAQAMAYTRRLPRTPAAARCPQGLLAK